MKVHLCYPGESAPGQVFFKPAPAKLRIIAKWWVFWLPLRCTKMVDVLASDRKMVGVLVSPLLLASPGFSPLFPLKMVGVLASLHPGFPQPCTGYTSDNRKMVGVLASFLASFDHKNIELSGIIATFTDTCGKMNER